MAARMRPKFGSDAKKAVFTKGECAMAYAALKHSSTCAAAFDLTVMNLVAPSPSRTMACASCTATWVIVSRSCANSKLSIIGNRADYLPGPFLSEQRRRWSKVFAEIHGNAIKRAFRRMPDNFFQQSMDSSAASSCDVDFSMVAMFG